MFSRARCLLPALLAGLAVAALAPAAHADSYPYSISTGWGAGTSASLTRLTFTNMDDGYAPVSLPFDFKIFGDVYTAGSAAAVTTNGTFQFADTDTSYSNTALPAGVFDGAAIFPYWDDFDVQSQEIDPGVWSNDGVWYGTSGTAPYRTFVVYWSGHLHAAPGRIQFWLELSETTNAVEMSYMRNMTDPMLNGSGATIGMQRDSAGPVVQYSYDTNSIPHSDFYIRYAPQLPASTAPPAVSGTPQQGQTLSASPGTWSGSPHAYDYQWERCSDAGCSTWTNIAGATSSTYAAGAADVGHKVFAAVKARNGWGLSQGWAFSYPVGPVTSAVSIPANTAAPQVSGSPTVGSTLTATHGTWTGSPDSYGYEWWRCMPAGGGGCIPSAIAGATSSTYVTGSADLGGTVWVRVRAHNAAGWSGYVGSSNSIGPIQQTQASAPVNTVRPQVEGIPAVDATLTATQGTWTGSPDSYAYQWVWCDGDACSNLPGQTGSTYLVDGADEGLVLSVKVAAHNAAGWSSYVMADNEIGPIESETEEGDGPGRDRTGQDGKGQTPDRGRAAGPALGKLKIKPKAFRAARRGKSIGGAKGFGAEVSFTLDRAAKVRFTVERQAAGRRTSGGKCVAQTNRNRRARRCTRLVGVQGSFSVAGKAGRNGFRFSGRLAGHALAVGKYRLLATPSANGDKGATAGVSFVVKRAAIASTAATQRYKGKVKGAGPVSFQLRGGKVKQFQASMTVGCVAVAPGLARTETYVIAPTGSAKVDRKGRFKLEVDLPKQQFVDDTGKVIATLYSVKAEAKGKVSGRSAEGTAKVSYNRNQLSGGTIVVVACTSGKTPIKWTARRK